MYRFAILLLLTLAACSTSKRLGPLPERTQAEILKALRSRNIDFRWFNGKSSTSLVSPDEQVSGSMHIRMVKDSVLWVAVKKFGIEAARLLADNKQYTILYRLEAAYESGSITQINDIISVKADFRDIQQLMFGNVILPEDNLADLRTDSIYYILHTKVDGIIMEYYVNGYNLQMEKMTITDKMNRTTKALFSDYRDVGGYGSVAFERTFEFPYSSEEKATLNMKFSEIEINVPKEIKFSIPDSYEKIN